MTDIDNDGWQDVMTTNYQDNSTTLYFNSIGINHTVPASNNNSGTSILELQRCLILKTNPQLQRPPYPVNGSASMWLKTRTDL